MTRRHVARSTPFTSARWSVLAGLAAVMLLSIPRYWFLRDDTRLTLLLVLLVAVGVALAGFWYMMASDERARCPAALRNLAICLVVGCVAIALWHVVEHGAQSLVASVIVSQGAALGLLVHVLSRLWRERR